MTWQLLLAANVVVSTAYFAIFLTIARGLRQAGQLGRRNPLGTATAAIFFTCGLGHLGHALHLMDPWFGLGNDLPRLTADWHLVAIDAATALVAVTYFSLRRSYGILLQRNAALFSDVDRDAMQEQVRQAEELFRTSFEDAPIGMALVGLDGRFLRVNRALCRITGRAAETLVATTFQAITHPDDLDADVKQLHQLVAGELPGYQMRKRYVRPDGVAVPVELSVSLVRDAEGRPRPCVAQVEDISARTAAEAARDVAVELLRELADKDPLTGLANRRRLDTELRDALDVVRRHGTRAALVLLDLDGFKYVNDTLGHSAGDQLIVRCGQVLRSRLRSTDVLARLGGDEFAVILPGVTAEQAEAIADELVDAVRRDAVITVDGGRRARVSSSAGVVTVERGTTWSSEELLSLADIALYEAKDAGRDRVRRYVPSEGGQARLTAGAEWLARLRDGLEQERFQLYAQPIVGLHGQGPPFHELLLRLSDSNGEVWGPSSFLPMAERSGLIVQVDRWVLAQAVALLHAEERAGRQLSLAVNLSGRTLVDVDLAGYLEGLLREQPVSPGRLVIEVTETAAISNIEQARTLAERLHGLGCRFALDDFGAGFSSFYYLKYLPLDYLKIDGEFVEHLRANAVDRLVVEAAVGIARGLGTQTIAEFVGDDETLETLRELGVDFGQGFHLGEPRPIAELVPGPEPDPASLVTG